MTVGGCDGSPGVTPVHGQLLRFAEEAHAPHVLTGGRGRTLAGKPRLFHLRSGDAVETIGAAGSAHHPLKKTTTM